MALVVILPSIRQEKPYSPTARRFERDGAVYLPKFLEEDIFDEVRRECRSLRPMLKLEKNCIAIGRLGRVLDSKSASHKLFYGEDMRARLQELLELPPPFEPSEFPLELRHYPAKSGMQWHTVCEYDSETTTIDSARIAVIEVICRLCRRMTSCTRSRNSSSCSRSRTTLIHSLSGSAHSE